MQLFDPLCWNFTIMEIVKGFKDEGGPTNNQQGNENDNANLYVPPCQ